MLYVYNTVSTVIRVACGYAVGVGYLCLSTYGVVVVGRGALSIGDGFEAVEGIVGFRYGLGRCLYLGDIAYTVVAVGDGVAFGVGHGGDTTHRIVGIRHTTLCIPNASDACTWGIVISHRASVS